ncbi:hypothetical protein K439DRAFT_1513061 [Ramaria rubella]|nr:hypothetical protein K439DRAFT_1513061 [Ramaria rubella]
MSTITHYTYTDTFGYETRGSRSELPSQFTVSLRGSTEILPSYIYRLPVEILARIFEIGTHESDDPNDPVDFPVQVAAVSRYFRAVACGTSRLWTTLNFHSPRPSWFDENAGDDYEYTYTRDRIWLERSGVYPLDLVMCFRDMTWSFNEEKHYFRREHMERILFLVAPHARRIRRFTLICDTFAPLHAALLFLAAYGSVMENLETLELYRCNEFSAELPVFHPIALAGPIPLLGGSVAPKLMTVVLSGVHVDWNRSKAPLSNLKTLELAYHSDDVRPSLFDFADILESSPDLLTLSVIDSGPSLAEIRDGDCSLLLDGVHRIRLRLLETFKMGYNQPISALTLLHLTDAPFITDLTIKDTSRPSDDETDGGSLVLMSLASTHAKPFPRLTSLSLDTVKTTPQAFAELLRSCDGIQSLKLDHVSNEVLPILAQPYSSPENRPPCPALRQLTLCAMPGLGAGIIARARDAAGMALDSLSISFRDVINDAELELAKNHVKVVTVVSQPLDEDEDYVMDWGENEDPYAPGGIFNDPEFDAMFS